MDCNFVGLIAPMYDLEYESGDTFKEVYIGLGIIENAYEILEKSGTTTCSYAVKFKNRDGYYKYGLALMCEIRDGKYGKLELVK